MKIEFLKIDEKVLSDSKKEELKKKLEDKKIMKTTEIRKLRSEVKKVMWKYYSENKSSLPDYISEFREEIIVELMKGQSVEVVFDSYGNAVAVWVSVNSKTITEETPLSEAIKYAEIAYSRFDSSDVEKCE